MSAVIALICFGALMAFVAALTLCLALNSDPDLDDLVMVTQGRPLTIWAVLRCWLGYLAPWRYGRPQWPPGRALGLVRRR